MTDLSSIIALHGGALGDFVLTQHVLARLRQANRRLRIDVVARSPFARWAAGRGGADTAHDYHSYGLEQLFHGEETHRFPLAKKLSQYDLVLSFLGGRDSAPASFLRRARLNAICIDPAASDDTIRLRRHIIQQWLDALKRDTRARVARASRPRRKSPPTRYGLRLRPTRRPRRPSLPVWTRGRRRERQPPLREGWRTHAPKAMHVRKEERRSAASRLASLLGSDHRPRVIVHPGSGSRAKCCPVDTLEPVVAELRERGCGVAWMVGPTELDWYGQKWVARLRRAAPVVHDDDVSEAASLIIGADVYLGNDAGMTHVAAALGVATVALFGPSDPHVWRPLGSRVSVIECGPHFDHLDAPALLRALLKPSRDRLPFTSRSDVKGQGAD